MQRKRIEEEKAESILTFTDADGVCLGHAIVEGEDVRTAVRNAWENNCNPGGQVMVGEPEEDYRQVKRNTLYPCAEWKKLTSTVVH